MGILSLGEAESAYCTDKQNALRRECTFKIEIVLEIGVAGVNIDLNITVLTLSDDLARLAQSVRPANGHRFLQMTQPALIYRAASGPLF